MRKRTIAIIGGGYYGSFAAYNIAQKHPDANVLLLERDARLFQHASSTNQGQLHLGYVYSGDPELARDCIREAPSFTEARLPRCAPSW